MSTKNYTNLLLLILIGIGISILILQIITVKEDKRHGYVDFDKLKKKCPSSQEKKKKELNMREAIDPTLAQWGVDEFRKLYNYNDYCIVYDIADFDSFAVKIRRILDSLSADEKKDSCWKVGLYPYLRPIERENETEFVVDMAFVPTIVPRKSGESCDTSNLKKAIDYFKDETGYYNKSKILAYDFGNMHP